MNIKIFLFAAFFLLIPMTIFAHPGGLDSNGGHYCWTNCASWGEVYGQWHSHRGGSSGYTIPTYTIPTYTPTYSTYKSNSDCPSYGFAYLGSCYELPDNAKKSLFSGFTCNYGYEEVGYGLSKKCLPEVDNGMRIGTSIFCDYGYELRYGSCLKKGTSSYGSGYTASSYDFDSSYTCPKNSSEDKDDPTMCTCNVGYEVNKDKDACKKVSKNTNNKICRTEFGRNSIWSGKYDKEEGVATCKCKKGYEWNEEGTSCTKALKR